MASNLVLGPLGPSRRFAGLCVAPIRRAIRCGWGLGGVAPIRCGWGSRWGGADSAGDSLADSLVLVWRRFAVVSIHCGWGLAGVVPIRWPIRWSWGGVDSL